MSDPLADRCVECGSAQVLDDAWHCAPCWERECVRGEWERIPLRERLATWCVWRSARIGERAWRKHSSRMLRLAPADTRVRRLTRRERVLDWFAGTLAPEWYA